MGAGDWSYPYFAFNVILAMIWGMISTVVLIGMPIVESRKVGASHPLDGALIECREDGALHHQLRAT